MKALQTKLNLPRLTCLKEVVLDTLVEITARSVCLHKKYLGHDLETRQTELRVRALTSLRCAWTELEYPILAVNQGAFVGPAPWKTIHYLKKADAYVN